MCLPRMAVPDPLQPPALSKADTLGLDRIGNGNGTGEPECLHNNDQIRSANIAGGGQDVHGHLAVITKGCTNALSRYSGRP